MTSQPEGTVVPFTGNFLKPGMLLAAIVFRAGGHQVGADALRAELLGQIAADALQRALATPIQL